MVYSADYIVIAVFDILLRSMTGQVQYRFLATPVFLSFQELMNEIVILLPDLFGYMKKKMTQAEFAEWADYALYLRSKAENGEIEFEVYEAEIRK